MSVSFEAPQMYRWKDPSLPPNAPSLQVYFLQEPQINHEATKDSGIQTYDNVLIAYISPVGQPKSNASHEIERTLPDGTVKVNALYSAKYAEQIKHYKSGIQADSIGTPLKELLNMTPALQMNLRARGVHTIEMLADMADGAGQDIMGFWDLRDRAKKHIETREKNAPALKMEAALAERDQQIATLQKQLDDLIARLPSEPEKRGPGRPRKEAEAA